MSGNKRINGIPFSIVENEYTSVNDIFHENHRAIRVLNTFERCDRRLLILYAEHGCSVKKLSRMFNVCERTMRKKLYPIRKEFQKRYAL